MHVPGVEFVMLYLSPVWHSLQERYRHRFGYIQNVHSAGVGDGIRAGYPWLLDNGCFSERWQPDKWESALQLWQEYAGTCIAAVCPDVVGDAGVTLERFWQYAPLIREYGYPVAFVTQDKLQIEDVPWREFDVLFIGGTDEHKLNAMPFVVEGKERGKWVHVGRVNSVKRMEMFWIADSCDGTTLAFEPSNQTRLYRAMQSIAGRKKNLCFTF